MSKYKVYDENNNFIGEFVGDFVETTKDSVSDSFDTSFGTGCLTVLCILAFKFPWLIVVIIGWGLLKLIWIVLKFVGRIVWWLLRFTALLCWWLLQEIAYGLWWLIRVPFTLILNRNVPYWWFPLWWFPKW